MKIAIIDDQRLFAESFKHLLEVLDSNFVISVLPAPVATKKYKIPNEQFDIIFLDINMHPINGFEVAKEILDRSRSQNIIFLSSREDETSINKAKDLGVKGYLFKSQDGILIKEIIKKIHQGETYYQSKGEKTNTYTFENGLKATITIRETEFLRFLLEEFTTKEIAFKMFVSPHTVIGYRKSLFAKLEVNNMIGLAKYALEIFNR